ncbi:MAG: DoxX family protein [Janthinobacterium lividum]
MRSMDLLARLCLVCLFPPSAYDKLKHRQLALEQARSGPLPDAPLLIDVGMVVETVAPLCIVTGKYDRPAALVLAGFCAVTAVGYHQFWTHDDLRAPGQSRGRDELWEFLKNFGLVGGLLMIAFPPRPRR